MVQGTDYHWQRRCATLVGLGLIGYSGWLTWDHSQDVAAPMAACVGAGMFHFGEIALRSRRWISGCLVGALGILAVLISLGVVIDRTASRYDARTQAAQTTNLPKVQAQQALAEEKEALVTAEAVATAECTSGRKAKCLGLEVRAEAARERVVKARAALVGLGAQQAESPSARRIAALLNVSEASVATFHPLLLPVWLELSGLALLTLGLSPSKPARVPEQKPATPKAKVHRPWHTPRGKVPKKIAP